MFNRALLEKWLWCYATESEGLWRSVVEVKYDSLWEGWCSNAVFGSYGVGVRKTLGGGGISLDSWDLRWEDGSKINFWQDVWCSDQTLKESFLVLFNIACYKESLMADHMLFSNDTVQWNITFIRSVHDWEVETVSSFFKSFVLIQVELRWWGLKQLVEKVWGVLVQCWVPNIFSWFIVKTN